MKRLVITGIAAVASLALVAGANGDGKRPTGSKTIRLQAKLASIQPVDNAPAGESAGDLLVFAANLSEQGRQIGEITESCALVTPPALYQCTATASLPKGTLAIAGRPDLSKEVSKGAITGGTGGYRRARGTVRTERLSETTERITFRILD